MTWNKKQLGLDKKWLNDDLWLTMHLIFVYYVALCYDDI